MTRPPTRGGYSSRVAAGDGAPWMILTILRVAPAKEFERMLWFAEYDFRYNHRTALGFNDGERAALVKNADGKRLTYQQPH